MALRVGVDIGGTFTDFVLIDDVSGAVHQSKALTTYPDPSEGVTEGLGKLLDSNGTEPRRLKGLVHGTTLVANAMIQRRGSRTALLTTQGYGDVLEIGRELKYDLYDLDQERPEPLVPRFWRRQIDERIGADGSVVRPLALDGLASIAHELEGDEIESVAVSMIHAYVNPDHERRVRAWLEEHYPGWTVSISSEVAPEIRELERTSTTVANAYVQPLVEQYLEKLEREFRGVGFAGSFHLMLSSGGVGSPETARRLPIWLIESGAAAGAMAAGFYARTAEIPRVLSFDMGGTTAKICLVDDGEPMRTNEIESARIARFKRFSGIPLRMPALELIEIGAGGGSIANVDPMGLLRVGPLSAGADPGPACYGRGGDRPTVTDADLLLGYLNPDHFLDGAMTLNVSAAERAIEEHVADPLGLDVTEAAIGISQVVNDNMATASRMHVIEKGRDPRLYTLVVFGGAGPVHGYEIARMLHAQRVVYLLNAGVASAMGLLMAPFSMDLVGTHFSEIEALDWAEVKELYSRFEKEATATLVEAGADVATIHMQRTADMRYAGQAREVSVEIPQVDFGPDMTGALRDAFFNAYRNLYGRHLTNVAVEAVNWRLHAVAPPSPFKLEPASADGPQRTGPAESRRAYFHELGAFVDCPTYDAVDLTPDSVIAGPAIVEQPGSTIVIGPSGTGRVDRYLNLVVELSHAEGTREE